MKKLLTITLCTLSLIISNAQNEDIEAYLKNVNTQLSQLYLPEIASFLDFTKNYEDDRAYLIDIFKEFKPYESTRTWRKEWPYIELPSIDNAKKCIAGSCKTGEGVMEIHDNAYYLGNFEAGKPSGQGFIYIVDKAFLSANFRNGILQNGQLFGKSGYSLKLFTASNNVYRVESMYVKEYNAFYSGNVMKDFKFEYHRNLENRLVSQTKDLFVRQDDRTSEVTGFKGEILYDGGIIIEGEFKPDFSLNDGKLKIKKPDGTVIKTNVSDGEIERYFVTIEENDFTYAGEVDENFKPHGYGVLYKNGEKSPNENWEHGKPVQRNNTSVVKKSIYGNQTSSSSNANKKEEVNSQSENEWKDPFEHIKDINFRDVLRPPATCPVCGGHGKIYPSETRTETYTTFTEDDQYYYKKTEKVTGEYIVGIKKCFKCGGSGKVGN